MISRRHRKYFAIGLLIMIACLLFSPYIVLAAGSTADDLYNQYKIDGDKLPKIDPDSLYKIDEDELQKIDGNQSSNSPNTNSTNSLKEEEKGYLDRAGDWLSNKWDSTKKFFSDTWDSITKTSSNAWDTMVDSFPDMWDWTKEALELLVVKITGGLVVGVLKAVGDTLFAIVDLVVNSVLHPIDTVSGLFENISNAILHPIDTANAIWQGITEFAQDIKDKWNNGDARSRAELVGYALGQIAIAIIGGQGASKASKLAKTAKGRFSSKGLVSNLVAKLPDFIKGTVGTVVGATSKMWNSAKGIATNGLNWIKANGKKLAYSSVAGVAAIGAFSFIAPKVAPVVYKIADCVTYQQNQTDLHFASAQLPFVKCFRSPDEKGGGNGSTITKKLKKSELGEHLGSGGNKDVYAYGKDKAIGVLKPGKPESSLNDELKLLAELDKVGLPTVNAELVTVEGRSALMYDRFAQGSKDVVKIIDGKAKLVGESPYLNQQSINDLKKIRDTMVNKNIKIDDLQFMIGKDGKVVISDPLDVFINKKIKGKRVKPSPNNLKMIDLMIEAARKNL